MQEQEERRNLQGIVGHYMSTIHRLLKEQGMTEADTKFSLDFLIS